MPGLAPPSPAERRRLLSRLSLPPAEAARALLGTVIVRSRAEGVVQAARIVETEAYLAEDDPAAHAFRGRTPRNAPLWGPPGTLYVYFVYGMHHCLNFSVDRAGAAGCVLVRAAEPLEGLEPGSCRGPGRLCRALGIDTSMSGRHVFEGGATLWLREGRAPLRVGVSTRIGIRLAADRPLRFVDLEAADVSAYRGTVAPL